MKKKSNVIKEKFNAIVHNPKFNKYMDVCTSVVDIAFKLGSTGGNPLLLVPALGSIAGVAAKALGSDDYATHNAMNAIGVEDVDFNTAAIILGSNFLSEMKSKLVVKDDEYTLFKLDFHEKYEIYLHKWNHTADGATIVANPKYKQEVVQAVIDKCFSIVGSRSVEIVGSELRGALIMRPLSSTFKAHELDQVLPLTDGIHKSHLENESIAYIFYGPPGVGKTTMALSVAELMNMTVLMLGPEAIGKMTGKSLTGIISGLKPGMIILDDIDKGNCKDLFYTTLNQIRAEFPKLVVIATTNDLGKLGNAFLRPGRGGELISFGPPDEEEKKIILDKLNCPWSTDIASLIDPRATHDWVDHIGRKVKKVKTLEEGIAVVETINKNYRLAEKAGSSGQSMQDYYEDDE